MNSCIKRLVIIVILLNCKSGLAQITNVKFGDDLLLEKVYAGFDSQMILPNDSLATTAYTSLKLGSALSWKVTEELSVYSHGVIQWSNTNPTLSITALILNYKLSDKLKIGVGLPPTATTFTRAHPITWRNQSESYAQSRITGNKLGAILQYSLSDNLRFAYSFQNNNGDNWANHLNIAYKSFQIAGYIQDNSEYFISIRLDNRKVDFNYNYSSSLAEHASSVFYNINNNYTFLADFNYSTAIHKSDVLRFGFRRYFKSAQYPAGAFIAVSYDVQKAQTLFRLFLHLN